MTVRWPGFETWSVDRKSSSLTIPSPSHCTVNLPRATISPASSSFGFHLTVWFVYPGDHSRLGLVLLHRYSKEEPLGIAGARFFFETGWPSCHPVNSVKALNRLSLNIYHHYWLSLSHFNGHFPGEPWSAGVYWSKGWWKWCWQLEL